MRILAMVLAAGWLAGCGPLFVPMLPRLEAGDQQAVDVMWDNLLTPVQRVDRQTLLDANVAYWMYAIGVDRLRMTSEKHFSGGLAVMEVDCDRANPDADQFTITVFDERGRTVRRERYSREDVERSAQMLRGIGNLGPSEMRSLKISEHATLQIGDTATQPATGPNGPPELIRLREESARRQIAAAAATQPARLP